MAKRIAFAAFLALSLLVSPFNAAQASHRGPDSVITANVEQALEKALPSDSMGTNSYRIDVFTSSGIVTLRGEVTSEANAKAAIAAAQAVPDVKSVVSNLSIRDAH